MMRPVSLVLPPRQAVGLTSSLTGTGANRRVRLEWQDNSITETSFLIQRTTDNTTWTDVGTVDSPLDQPNEHGTRSFVDPTSNATTPYRYRVVARNTAGYGRGFPTMTARSVSAPLGVNLPAAPTALTAAVASGPLRVALAWQDNATNETGFVVERSTDGVTFARIGTVARRTGTGAVSFTDSAVTLGTTYHYRVSAENAAGASAVAGPVSVLVGPPPAPSGLTASATRTGGLERLAAQWDATPGAVRYDVQWSLSPTFDLIAGTGTTTTTAYAVRLPRATWHVRVRAVNSLGSSTWALTSPVSPPQ